MKRPIRPSRATLPYPILRRRLSPTDLVAVALFFTGVLMLAGSLVLSPPQDFRSFLFGNYPVWLTLIANGAILFLVKRLVRRQEKARILDQLGSESNDFALDAVRKVRHNGWLTDGALAGRNLDHANLAEANLRGAWLAHCSFNYANLRGARFFKANLTGAQLLAANLRGAELRSARLVNANLRGANLENAILNGADLTGADLRYTRLTNACIESALTDGALFQDNLTAGEIAAIQESFQQVLADLAGFTQHFYLRLFHLAPAVRELFLGNMRQQRQKFVQTMDVLISSLEDDAHMIPVIQALGRSHAGFGVRNEHYQVVGSALLWALEKSLGYDYSEELGLAWQKWYDMVATLMQDAAQEAG